MRMRGTVDPVFVSSDLNECEEIVYLTFEGVIFRSLTGLGCTITSYVSKNLPPFGQDEKLHLSISVCDEKLEMFKILYHNKIYDLLQYLELKTVSNVEIRFATNMENGTSALMIEDKIVFPKCARRV